MNNQDAGQARSRWSKDRIYEFPEWVRNDIPKYSGKPGLVAAAERAELAADLLDAVIAVHAGCRTEVCPTRQAWERVLIQEEGGRA